MLDITKNEKPQYECKSLDLDSQYCTQISKHAVQHKYIQIWLIKNINTFSKENAQFPLCD